MTQDTNRSRRPSADPAHGLVLASGSPRRREILTAAGIEFEAIPSDVAEEAHPGEDPHALAARLAEEKALSVAKRMRPGDRRLVLGADTIVVLAGTVLGKPDDAEHAISMLSRLAGRRHRVITGISVVDPHSGATRSRAVESQVTMREAEVGELRDYVETGEPLDKAGAYAIQGEGGRRFVTGLEGSESNVIGLPLEETRELLAQVSGARGASGGSEDP